MNKLAKGILLSVTIAFITLSSNAFAQVITAAPFLDKKNLFGK